MSDMMRGSTPSPLDTVEDEDAAEAARDAGCVMYATGGPCGDGCYRGPVGCVL